MRLNVFASANQNTLGYGVYSKNLTLALNREVPVTLFPIDGKPQSLMGNVMASRHVSEPLGDVSLSISGPSNSMSFHGLKRAYITMWEGSTIPGHIVHQLNKLDMLVATSEWMKEMYVASGVRPEIVCVVKGGVDTRTFKPLLLHELEHLKKDQPFKFVTVGKYEERKASALIVRAFLETFSPEDNVVLDCKFTSPTTIPLFKIKESLKDLFKAHDPQVVSKVRFVDRDLPNLVDLYQQADCLVMPSRAEGVGLPLLEAMACGVPVITTPYSSHQEYFAEHCGVMLPDQGQCPAVDQQYGINPKTHGTWGNIDHRDIGDAMSKMHKTDNDTIKKMRASARDNVLKYDWNNMAQNLIRSMEEMFHGNDQHTAPSENPGA